MGLKTSVWLPDDLAERVKASGVPLAELIRRGLGADAPDPLEVRLAAVIRAEFEARFRPGSPVMPVVEAAPVKRAREKAPKAAPAADGPAATPSVPPAPEVPAEPPPAVFSGPVAKTAADVAAQLETVQPRGSGHAPNCKCLMCKPAGKKS